MDDFEKTAPPGQAASSPEVTVCIVSWNQKDLLKKVLLTLLKNTRYRPVRFLVADNGSTDDGARMVKEDFPDVQVLELPENLGYSKGLNLAFSHCTSPLLAQVNSDVFVREGWLEALVEGLENHPEAGLVGGRVLFPDGATQSCGDIYRPLRNIFAPKPFDPGDRYTEVGYHGPVFLVRREAWLKVGGFEPGYSPGYYEDAELGVDMRLAGWKAAFVPECRVTHAQTKSFALLGKKKFLRIYESNRLRFVFRNYPASWLFVHLMMEWVKALSSLYRCWFPQYLAAWKKLLSQGGEIRARRRKIKKNRRYREVFPPLLGLLRRPVKR